ncbi:MAG TPA: Gfo/Idh/MocA family oxidoreductase [Clostridia bacterium]
MYRIGIVGIGGMGTVHFNNYKHINIAKVVSVCDSDQSRGELFASENRVTCYKTIDEMLKNEELDVIDVCTPTFTHRENVLKAIDAKKHVICEKPLDLTLAGAKQMIEAAEKAGVMLFVGQVLQYARETEVLRDLVNTNIYGKVLDAQFLRLSACPKWIKNGWLFEKEKSGLLPFDLHIHDLDLIISLFGVPKDFSFTCCGNEGKDYKEHYRFTYRYEDKSISAEAAWYNASFPFTAAWRVYFENAVVVNDGNKVTAYEVDCEPKIFDIEEKIKIPTGINLPPTGIFLAELSDFLSLIKPGKSGCTRKNEILATIGLLEKIQDSTL